jgi:hypothetical protein
MWTTKFKIAREQVWIFVARATCSLFFINLKIPFKVSKKIVWCRRCYVLSMCKFSIPTILYLRLYKNDKIWQILMFQKFTLFTTTYVRFCYFCIAYILRYFELKSCMLWISTFSICRFNFRFFYNFKILFLIYFFKSYI